MSTGPLYWSQSASVLCTGLFWKTAEKLCYFREIIKVYWNIWSYNASKQTETQVQKDNSYSKLLQKIDFIIL